MTLGLAALVWGIAGCALAQSQSLASETSPARKSEPFALYVFTMPRGAEAAKERMRAAVVDVERIVELSDWVELVDARDAADIVVEVEAYALASTEDGSVHHVYADVDVLGEELFLVGVDEHERASRMGAASDLMEKLRDYCVENFVRLDAKRRSS